MVRSGQEHRCRTITSITSRIGHRLTVCVPRIPSVAVSSRVAVPGGPAVMITDHVSAVRLPADHAGDHVAAAVPARGDVEDGRDFASAPPGHRPAAPPGVPPQAEPGGPGSCSRPCPASYRDRRQRLRLLITPGHDRALAARHPPAALGGAVHARQARPATRWGIKALVLRLAWETRMGYCRIHGELAGLGVKVAASTAWEILKTNGIGRSRRQAGPACATIPALPGRRDLASDFFGGLLDGTQAHVLAVVEHMRPGASASSASRRIPPGSGPPSGPQPPHGPR